MKLLHVSDLTDPSSGSNDDGPFRSETCRSLLFLKILLWT